MLIHLFSFQGEKIINYFEQLEFEVRWNLQGEPSRGQMEIWD